MNNYIIPGFQIVDMLGNGAFSLVLRVEEKSALAMPRAVKILNPHPFANSLTDDSQVT